MQPGQPHALDLGYTQTMMGFLLFKPAPSRITMIGLGGGSIAKFCHHHLPDTQLQAVEINPHVIALRDDFFIPPDDARLQVINADGALFVRQAGHACDVLLVDGFDSQGQPDDLCSQRFYDDCFERLNDDGLAVINLHLGHVRYNIHLDRLRCSFGDSKLLVINDGDLSNSIVMASKGGHFDTLRPAGQRTPAQLDGVAAQQLQSAFSLIRAALKKRRLLRLGTAHPATADPADRTAD